MTRRPAPVAPREEWDGELDAMDAYLSAQREAFLFRHLERPAPRIPSPIDQLGPLPDALRARAEELLRATLAFEGEVTDARASLAAAMRQADRSVRQSAAYVDARA